MQFNSGTDSMIRAFAFWTRFPAADVTGDILTDATALMNRAFDDIMPLLLSYTDKPRWDDLNHTDRPVGKINIVSGKHDYTITADDNSLDILNLLDVRILQSSTATQYQTLERLTLDDELALDAMSPNSNDTSIPSYWLEKGNTVFLYPKPNYSATNGIKLFFEREQSYFTTADTTKEPGIPKPFHEILVLHAALRWNSVNRADDVSLLNSIRAELQQKRKDITNMIALRNPTKDKMTMRDNRRYV